MDENAQTVLYNARGKGMFTQKRISNRDTQLLEFYKPTFSMKEDMPESCNQASEIVLLQSVEALPLTTFAFKNSALAVKFKALLKILLHQHFTALADFYDEESNYTLNFISEKAYQLRDAIVQGDTSEFLSQFDLFKNFFFVRSLIFASFVTYNETKLTDMLAEMRNFFVEIVDSPENLYQNILKLMHDYYLYMSLLDMKKSLEQFSLVNLINTLNTARHIDIESLCERHELTSEINNFTDLNNNFIAFHDNYINGFKKTIQNMNQAFFLNLDITVFSKFYDLAFAELISSPTTYHDNYFKQLYLEQVRKPQLRPDILNLISITLLPVLNDYRRHIGISEEIELSTVRTWAAITAYSNDEKDLFSVHQILDTAYFELFSPNPPLPSLASVDEKEEVRVFENSILEVACGDEPDQLFTGLTVRNEDIKPLFKGKTPGLITREEISIVTKINHQAVNLEKRFEDKDRKEAVEEFYTSLSDMRLPNTLAISRIAALLEVSDKYINIHKYPNFDEKVGKTNTNTWSKTLKVARTQGLNIIKEEVKTAKKRGNVSVRSIEELEYFRNHSLFSRHRSNYKIFGAFWRTHAQVEIDSMISTLKQLKK
jgi:hypothetical protein